MASNSLNNGIISLSINEEHSMFAASQETGVRIYNIDPPTIKANLRFAQFGSIAICQLLHRTNLVALVAGGSKPKFSENFVRIWDDEKKRFFLELEFPSPVLAVKMRRDRLVVVENTRFHCFSFPNNVKQLFTIETRENPLGLCEISPYISSDQQILVYPGNNVGSIHIMDLTLTNASFSTCQSLIPAHTTSIACMAINKSGTMIATASTKGTLVRVFNSVSRSLLAELRRGADTATIYCIEFSHDSEFLVVASDTGTIHIFAVKKTDLNRRSSFAPLAFVVGQFVESQWSLATFTIASGCPCVCGFGPNYSVYAICNDGNIYNYKFSRKGDCYRDSYEVFLDITDEF